MRAYIYEWNGVDGGRVYVVRQRICRAAFGLKSCDQRLREVLGRQHAFGYPEKPIAVTVAGVDRLHKPWQAYGLQATPLTQ